MSPQQHPVQCPGAIYQAFPVGRRNHEVNEGIHHSAAQWGIHGRDVPAIALETKPGDVVCFNHNTKHSAWGGSGRRRMFTINLSERYPEERIEALRAAVGGFSRYWVDRAYGQTMVDTAGPERMRHLEQIMANDGHLAELTRQAKETMSEPGRG